MCFLYHRGSIPFWREFRWSCHTFPDMVCCPQHKLSFCKHSFFNCPAMSFDHFLHISAATLLGFLPLFIQPFQVLTPFCRKDLLLLLFHLSLHNPQRWYHYFCWAHHFCPIHLCLADVLLNLHCTPGSS